ncbi:MAG TPA: hypothetical protein DD477_10025 [Spirochaetaceae bacterium]|nr:hypothetical protein [Spirochaetaceae bacterium]HAW86791.1 hypothetical protein [Spirochaetaceae bacterium]HAX37017.1 hypothetical protein [Spirochaetaceae bacterium]HBO41537.1 hypothetical protein [Spirochaetaceae bacterium]
MTDSDEPYRRAAAAAVADLPGSPYFVTLEPYEGLRVEAVLAEGSLRFCHNLGGFHCPSRAEAVAQLAALRAYYQRLQAASDEFRALAAGRRFSAELYVFSGQMDFPVATQTEAGTVWQVALDT